jgi:hypothetical protein
MICVAAKGFLTQSDCGAPAARSCAHCGRQMCTMHLAPQTGFSMCLDCAATQQQPTQEQGAPQEYNDTWARGYRNSYYGATGYRPYHDTTDTYNRHDSSSFDEGYEMRHIDVDDGGFDVS